MKKKIPYLFIICLVAMLCVVMNACRKSFSSSDLIEDKLVVLSEIVSGDSVKIPIGRTFKVGNGGIIRFDKLNDAKVMIRELNGPSYALQPNFSPEYSNNAATIYTNRRRLRTNTTYFLEVRHATLGTVTATTTILPAPHISFVDTASQAYAGKQLLACKIAITDILPADNYMIEAVKELLKVRHFFFYNGVRYDYDTPEGYAKYQQVKSLGVLLRKDTVSQKKFLRINIYTEDPHSVNADLDILQNPFRRIFYSEKDLNSTAYNAKIYLDPTFFVAMNNSELGRIRLQVKRCSKELFDYLVTYEKYRIDFSGLPSTQLNSPNGNISNGLGIFGGASRRENIFYFDKLE